MLRERLSEKFSTAFYDTPKKRYNLKDQEENECNERKWALAGLIVSFVVITMKIFTNNSKYIIKARHQRILI